MARPTAAPDSGEYIHYGTHFTSMFRRCYADRVTTRRMDAEGRLKVLDRLREEALHTA
ncbi:hypothetical protein [Streptomyces sp. TLI_185]|uniref:hypothetical protein n=1 Tax=Streptomyces sp. TLI_185 TaxID=2485151 RepID=UPI0021A5E85E|nr:hypothetical protein [Streptomyces sp. TLI_185]